LREGGEGERGALDGSEGVCASCAAIRSPGSTFAEAEGILEIVGDYKEVALLEDAG
jgi:hypothetical protein